MWRLEGGKIQVRRKRHMTLPRDKIDLRVTPYSWVHCYYHVMSKFKFLYSIYTLFQE